MTVRSPLTDSEQVTLLSEISTSRLIERWKETYRLDIKEEFHHVPVINHYRCDLTHLKFFLPEKVAGSEKLYEQLHHFDWYYILGRWEHQVALRALSIGQRVLEIGAAYGDFVQAGLDAGLQIYGIELNKAAIEIARQKQRPVEYANVLELALSEKETFDAICCFQVLEHVSRPKEFLLASLNLLKPGGTLILTVPNANSFLRHQQPLLDMPPHHMTQWTETTFQVMESLFPLKIEVLRRESLASYHIAPYLETYYTYTRSRFHAAKMFFNHYTMPLYQYCLQMGGKRFFIGQTLYIQFRKLS
jgi:2-polyprenyl-3-methyl-5-hydroxy-6-metoxy-1,4-benzoquinol methylase